jgi:hypothetical protein
MNMIDWLRSTAEWMRKDSPEWFSTNNEALLTLEGWVETVRADLGSRLGIEQGGYSLMRTYDDGVEEWTLHKKISTCALFEEEGDCVVYGWVNDIELPPIEDA